MTTAATVLVFVGVAILASTLVAVAALSLTWPRRGGAVQDDLPARGGATGRIDRDEVYVGVLVALWLAGIGIMVTPIGSGTIATLEESTQKLLALCMMVGASIALLGSASGRPSVWITWPFRMAAKSGRLFGYDTAPVAVRHAYLMGAAGLIAFNVSLFFLGWTILTTGTVVGTATGSLTPILFVAYTKKMRRLFGEFLRLTKIFNEVVVAVTRTDEAGDP